MTSNEQSYITIELPHLRRYARLLTGHSRLGDVLVVAALQWVAGEPSPLKMTTDHRERLYRALTQLWQSPVSEHLKDLLADKIEIGETVRRLGAMAPVARAAFLLVWVEGFPRPVAARILDVGDGEFSALLNAANASISKLLATDVLIIEDELLIAFELEGVLKKLGHRVTSIARTHRMAVKQAQLQPPKLILADINLADGSSGMKAANEILTTTVAPVIFITAYPERLLTGGCPEPTFVITKPFRAEEIQAVVGQALFFDLKAQSGISADTCPSELISSCFPKSLRS